VILVGLAIGFGHVLGIAVETAEEFLVGIGGMADVFRQNELVLNEICLHRPHTSTNILV
jgi:hypothetical protein